MEILNKIILYYEEHGLKNLALRFLRPLRRIKNRLWSRKEYYILKKDVGELHRPPDYNDIIFKQFTEEMVDDIAPQLVVQYGKGAAAIFKKSIKEGDIIGVGLDPIDHRRLMCLSWISLNDPLFQDLRGKEILATDNCSRRLFVPETSRRKGFGSRGIAFTDWLAAEKGFKTLWGFVEKKNNASYQMFESKTDWIVCGRIRIGFTLGRKYLFTEKWKNYFDKSSALSGK
jgi:hypothetical protein